jgi:diacylglycerol kinase (ATP)
MNTAVIVNPVSGNKRSLRILTKAIEWCYDQGMEFKLYSTQKPGDGIRLGRIARLDGYERIVVIGGDGTVNEVVQGVIGYDIIIGVLPGGSGNDFYRMLGNEGNLDDAMRTAFIGKAHEIDVGVANGIPFVNAVGIGFDAQVALSASQSNFSGRWRYLSAVFKVLRGFIPYPLDIELEQVKLSEKMTLVCVGNGRNCGGGFHLTPQAKFDDGLFDVCLISAMSKLKIIHFLPRAIKGTHIRLEGVRIYRSRKIMVRSANRFPVHVDGNVMPEPVDKLEITFDRRKLKVAIAEKTPTLNDRSYDIENN